MASATRGRVLSVFRGIHRTCQSVFAGDCDALAAGRLKINQEFKAKKDETDPKKIEEYIKWAGDSAHLLRKTVVQATLADDGANYTLKITKDTKMNDNIPYDPDFVVPTRAQRKRKSASKPGESS